MNTDPHRRTILRWLVLGYPAVGGVACSRKRWETTSDPIFQNDLARELGAVEKIRIVEVSSPNDLAMKVTREHLYREKFPAPESKTKLIGALRRMDPALPQALLACAPHFHHRIEFPGTALPPVLICFQCNQLSWAGTKGRYPAAIFQVLGDFLESEGFERSRDWDKLATHAEKASAQ